MFVEFAKAVVASVVMLVVAVAIVPLVEYIGCVLIGLYLRIRGD